jgi:hypothetical protein
VFAAWEAGHVTGEMQGERAKSTYGKRPSGG